MWAIYVALAAFVIGISFLFLGVLRKKRRSLQELSLSDLTNVASLFVNVVVLILAVVSLKIALSSYHDAQEGGKKQQDTLDASRTALEASVVIANKQQELLKKSLEASQSQFSLIQDQWRRELERPDVALLLLYPQQLSVLIVNVSPDKVARQIMYEARFWNMTNVMQGSFQFVGSVVRSVEYIRPKGAIGPNPLEFHPSSGPGLKAGDRLFGYLTVQCPDCARLRTYWASYEVGGEGFYKEGKWNDFPFVQFNPGIAESVVSRFRSQKRLLRISPHYR
jgi:hypothetical protein